MQDKNPKDWKFLMKRARPSSRPRSAAPHHDADVTADRVCRRLRELRKQRHWTLQQLADISGVSRSMLSQIERGQVNPTLAVTFRIARAFGRSLAELVEEPGVSAAMTVIAATDTTYRFRSDDTCRIRTLYPMHLEKDVEFYEVWLAPGGMLKSSAHFAGTREMVTVSKGKVAVTSSQERREVPAGDSAHYPADVPHAIENLGPNEALVYLVVVCPPG
jgi:transcriptional regulator with XRE-family HTH domain